MLTYMIMANSGTKTVFLVCVLFVPVELTVYKTGSKLLVLFILFTFISCLNNLIITNIIGDVFLLYRDNY